MVRGKAKASQTPHSKGGIVGISSERPCSGETALSATLGLAALFGWDDDVDGCFFGSVVVCCVCVVSCRPSCTNPKSGVQEIRASVQLLLMLTKTVPTMENFTKSRAVPQSTLTSCFKFEKHWLIRMSHGCFNCG